MAEHTPTTKEVLRRWLQRAASYNICRLLVVYDKQEDYDIFVFAETALRAQQMAKESFSSERLTVMECYDPKLDHEMQLAEHRAFHW